MSTLARPRSRADRQTDAEQRRLERLGPVTVGDRVRARGDHLAHGLVIRAQVRWSGQRDYLVTIHWDYPYGGRSETRVNVRAVERIASR